MRRMKPMAGRSAACWAPVAIALCSAGCSAPRQNVPQRPSLLESTRPFAREVSPAEWRYGPRQPARLARAYDLAEGQQLFVGGLGERWLSDPKRGSAEAASVLAPEPLVGALRVAGGAWAFVGQSGTTYAAETPLGPLSSANAPARPLAVVDVGREALLGIAENGALLSSDDAGASWRPVGPTGAHFSDVLLEPPHALALEVPERLWWSADEGRSWRMFDVPAFGAERLDIDDEAGPVITAALGARSVRWERNPPELAPLGRVVRPDEPKLPVAPNPRPSARAIATGRAFVNDGHYFEVELGVRAEALSGPFAGPLQRTSLPTLSPCQELRVAGFASWIYAACTRERVGAARRYEFFRSVDGGQTFERESFTARGNPELVKLAAGADGTLLTTGFCPPKDDLAGCRPQGIQGRHELADSDAGAGAELESVPAPALDETALALGFSADGRTAYAVGQRTKSDGLFLFVSTNLGRGFTAREISQLERPGPTVVRQVRNLSAARDGELSLVLGQATGPDQLVVLDGNGRTLSLNSAPLEVSAIGAYGARALAVGPDEAWESLNGGAQWQSVGRLPRSVCPAPRTRCAVAIACMSGGCSIGDSLTRLGWHGQANLGSALVPPTRGHERASRHALGAAYGCELMDAEWTPLAGVDRLPDATQAALGKVAWFALSSDDATASAGLWIAERAHDRAEGASRVRYSELLRPSERATETAYHATLQVEGGAALRYALPGSSGASSGHISRIEVAWENLFESRKGHATILDAGTPLPGDFVKTAGAARHAQADLVSIASGGLFVRVHHQPEHNQVSYFLDGASTEEIPALYSEQLPTKGLSNEMVRIGTRTLSISFVNQGATVVRAKLDSERWHFDAMSVGFVDTDRFSIRQQRDITYVQGRAALHIATRFADSSSEAFVFPLQADGAVFGTRVPVPTQTDVPDGAFGCSAQQRQGSARVLAQHYPGTRHPLLVHDRVEPLRVFLSDAAVLHGTPESACVAAYDAEPVHTPLSAVNSRERVLLSSDGPSWLFRVAPENTTHRDLRIEYRSMQCNQDPALEIPPEVYELPDTHSGD